MTNPFTAISFFLFFIFILIIFFKYFLKLENQQIEKELVKYFGAKKNLNGTYQIYIQNRKIIVEYDWEYSGKSFSEYIISYIDISDLNKFQQDELSKRYGIRKKIIKNFCKYIVIGVIKEKNLNKEIFK